MAPDPIGYTALVYGQSPGGLAVYRVVTDNLTVHYVGIPYQHSTRAEVGPIIEAALQAIYRPPKPLR